MLIKITNECYQSCVKEGQLVDALVSSDQAIILDEYGLIIYLCPNEYEIVNTMLVSDKDYSNLKG